MTFCKLYPHDEAGVGNLVVVGGVAVHQLHVEGELGQGDVAVHIVLVSSHPLHLDLNITEYNIKLINVIL